MLFKPILKKLSIIWATAFFVFITGVCATPQHEEIVEFNPLPQLIFPKQLQGLENYLFDHDISTRYSASLPSQVFTELGAERQTLDAIRVYGNAAYLLTTRANQQGQWTPIKELDGLNLFELQPDQWHEFKISTCVTTTNLLFDLTPLLQSEDMGLREIEIWVKATPGCSSGEKLTDLDNRENISNENQETDNSTKGTLSSSSAKTEKVIPGQAKKISHEEAELDINAEAVTVEKDLTIDALNDTNSESYFIC